MIKDISNLDESLGYYKLIRYHYYEDNIKLSSLFSLFYKAFSSLIRIVNTDFKSIIFLFKILLLSINFFALITIEKVKFKLIK